ncbi:MAG TPA: YetF domain-containing protein, partial [Hanamia sp.]|nr:YetF domain-containing protein [Hanamia sp.]
MEIINRLFGHGTDLNALQMSLRAIIIFFVALLLIRFTGMRVFGIKSAFDTCIIIMLGAVLARAVVGASPFIPTIVASLALVVVHKIIAMISVGNVFVSHLVKGRPMSLYKDGILNDQNLRKCSLSYGDVMEEVRLKMDQNNMDNIEEIFMERTGKISVIKKKVIS